MNKMVTYKEGCNKLMCGLIESFTYADDINIILKEGKCVRDSTGKVYSCNCGCLEQPNWVVDIGVNVSKEHTSKEYANSYNAAIQSMASDYDFARGYASGGLVPRGKSYINYINNDEVVPPPIKIKV